MNTLPLISHRMFAAAAGNGPGTARNPLRQKNAMVELKGGGRFGRASARDSGPPSAMEIRALRSAARDGI